MKSQVIPTLPLADLASRVAAGQTLVEVAKDNPDIGHSPPMSGTPPGSSLSLTPSRIAILMLASPSRQ
jgi:hypothetical protein